MINLFDRVIFTHVGQYPVEYEGIVLEVSEETMAVLFEEYPGQFEIVNFFHRELILSPRQGPMWFGKIP